MQLNFYASVFIACIYKPDKRNPTDLRKTVKLILEKCNGTKCLFAGDFNLDLLHPCVNTTKLCNIFERYGFIQLVKEATRGKALLDHLWVSDQFVLDVTVLDTKIADHKAVKFFCKYEETKSAKRNFSVENTGLV
jgi:hypothetical protein